MAGTDRSKLFISYSRADLAFTDELVSALGSSADFEILIDREGIAHGEDWRARLGRLIIECDTMVFVLSPDSVESEVCAWEVDEAQRLAKRIIPILWRAVDFTAVPAALSALNAVPFDGVHAVGGLSKLVTALNSDLAWLREHTRLGERAADWQGSGHATAYLLRGDALDAARDWFATRPANAPVPTELQRAFLVASEEDESRLLGEERLRLEALEKAKAIAEAERDAAQQARASEAGAARRVVRATTIGLGVAVALLIVATAAGWYAQRKADDARQAAHSAAAAAELAERRREAAQRIQSRFLARAAQRYLAQGDAANAIALARTALPSDLTDPDRPFAIEAAQVMFDAYGALHERATLRGHSGGLKGALALPDGRIVSWARDGTMRFWGAGGGLLDTVIAHQHPTHPGSDEDSGVHGLLRLDDGRLLTWGSDKTARLWRDDGSSLGIFLNEDAWIDIERLRDGRIAARIGDELRVWNAALEPRLVLRSPLPWLRGAILLRDGRFLTWQSRTGAPVSHTAMLWTADGMPQTVLAGHERMLLGAFELTGGRIVTFENGPSLRIWSAAGESVAVIDKAHEHAPFSAPFAFPLRDGRFYTWGQEAYHDHVWWGRVWDAHGESQALVEASDTPLQGMQLDDGRLLLGINTATPAIWHTDGTRGPLLSGHEAQVAAAAQWPDGRIATYGRDHTARLWSRDGDPLRVLRGHEGSVSGFESLSDERYLTWSFRDRSARIWGEDALPRGRIGLAGGDAEMVRELRSGRIAVRTATGVIALFGPDLAPQQVLRNAAREIDEMLELADGRLLTRGRNHSNREPGPALRLWSASGEVIADLAGPEVEIIHAAQTPSGHILGFDQAGRVWRWDADGHVNGTRDDGADSDPLYHLLPLSDGRFVTRRGSNRLRLWGAEGEPGRLIEQQAMDGQPPLPKEILPFGDGQLLVIDQRNATAVWDERDGQWRTVGPGGYVPVKSATALRAGEVLLNLFSGRLLIVSPDMSWREVPVPTPSDDSYPRHQVVRLDDGNLLVATSQQGTRLWDADGTPGPRILKHEIDGAIRLQDGSFAVWPAASNRNGLQIIGPNGEPGVVLRGHTGEVKRAMQLADGRILSWAGDASVRIWPGSVQQAVAWADDVIARLQPLTHAERCEHYLETSDDCTDVAPR